MKISRYIRVCSLFTVLAVMAAFIPARPGSAATLPQQEAERLLSDTYTLLCYMDLTGEADYADKPQNVLRAALFGAYDAKMGFAYEQEMRTEAGKPPLPANAPLFSVDGKPLPADQVVRRDEDSTGIFNNLPEEFTCFITKEAVELAAPYFTGHRFGEHVDPGELEGLGRVILNDKGYFVSIDGLGDPGSEPVLKQIEPQGNGFVLTGEIEEYMGDPDETKAAPAFRLELMPGEVPGAWKRQYTQQSAAL